MTLTIQQELVLRQKQQVLEMTERAGDALDAKSVALLQAAGLLLILISALKLPDFIFEANTIATLSVILALGAFVGMIISSIRVWAPTEFQMPGANDWNELQKKHLDVSAEDSFNQVLSDYIEAIHSINESNLIKAKRLKLSLWLLVIQLGGLIGLVLL